ncbi:MAG TPA: hypothetical protein VEQ60_09190 [Longimicrobium sp.]|nr:hypothetical protein [Longimicrobium sp.]
MNFPQFIDQVAAGCGVKLVRDEESRACVVFQGPNTLVMVYIAPRENLPNGDLLIEFFSVAKELPHDADVVEEVGYHLLLRNSTTGYAAWAFLVNENRYFIKATKNVLASELDPEAFVEVVASIAREYEYATQLSQIGSTLWSE